MTTLREAAQQALEAMESMSDCYVGDDDDAGECPSCHKRSYMPHAPDCEKQNAVTALRDALAQQEQEPVAWASWRELARIKDFDSTIYANGDFDGAVPLYTHPPRREWQGLSDEEIKTAVEASADFWATSRGWITSVARAVERALKEKNA